MAEYKQPWDLKAAAKAAAFLLLVLAFGLFCFFMWWHDQWLLREAPHWPRTDGVVVGSRVKVPRTMIPTPRYARIEYDYTVRERSGQPGRSRPYRDWVSSPGWPFEDEEEIAAQHPIGASVTVHYDPEDPGRSVLAAWLTWNHAGSWLWLVMDLVVLAFLGLVIRRAPVVLAALKKNSFAHGDQDGVDRRRTLD